VQHKVLKRLEEEEQQQQQLRLHPTRSMPFQQLFDLVTEAVAAGTLERSCDQATGLEVYSALPSTPGGVFLESSCLVCSCPL
jgi:hypothetical protein